MSAMLACRRFHGSHTCEGILQHFMGISGKVDNIITDNGSNMLKAFRLMDLQNEAINSDSTESHDEEELQPVEISNCSDLDIIKPNHYSCFAHTLQLVVKDGMENAEQIKRVLAKASRLVSFVRH